MFSSLLNGESVNPDISVERNFALLSNVYCLCIVYKAEKNNKNRRCPQKII
jgi:hypothetical protein